VTVYVLPAVKVVELGKAKLAVEAPSSKSFSVMVVGVSPAAATVGRELGELAGQLPAEQALTARAAA
jgi:hypothetical protein